MFDVDVRPSGIILLVTGFGLLLSLSAFSEQNVAPWLAFKLFFFVGLVALLFRR